MQAYATVERPATVQRLRDPDQRPLAPLRHASIRGESETTLLDQLLGRLADLVADRLAERTMANSDVQASEWMDARDAADYLGLHRDTLRKLAAQRAIPAHQDGPRCRLYFRRDELDDWRRSGRATSMRATRLRAV
jgi:excisionase family DNA binding protein